MKLEIIRRKKGLKESGDSLKKSNINTHEVKVMKVSG